MTQFNRPKQTEVTPGNAFQLGLPFVLGNQSLFNFWDIHTGNYFIEMEGEFYGWDNATVQVAENGPASGRPSTLTRWRRSSCSWRARSPSPSTARWWT